MAARKISYLLAQLFRKVTAFSKEVGLNWQYISMIIAALFLILFLISSIYGLIVRGKENYELISQEKEKLNTLEQEGKVLSAEVSYVQSAEFKENFARDNLNYARDNQELYYIKRPKSVEYEYLEKKLDPIDLEKYEGWWRVIVLGD